MISRVAESCFWLMRYIERVESLARLLHVNLAFQLDVRVPEAERWRPLIVVSGEESRFEASVRASQLDQAERVQEFLTWELDNPASLASSLQGARRNARTTRETISLEMWGTLNELWLWLNSRVARNLYNRDRHAFYVHLRDQCVLFQGFAYNTMLHETPFDFMRLGTSLERVNQTARTLDVKHHSLGAEEGPVELPAEAAQWLAILRSCAGVEPFFKRAPESPSGRRIAEFLLFEPHFPRSVRHNLDRARNFLRRIRTDDRNEMGARASERLQNLRTSVYEAKINSVFERGIHDYLTMIVAAAADVCSAVHEDFFDPPIRMASLQVQRGQAAS